MFGLAPRALSLPVLLAAIALVEAVLTFADAFVESDAGYMLVQCHACSAGWKRLLEMALLENYQL